MITTINEFKKINEDTFDNQKDGHIFVDGKKIPIYYNYYYDDNNDINYNNWSTCVKYDDISDIIAADVDWNDYISFHGRTDVNKKKYTLAEFISKINKFGTKASKIKAGTKSKSKAKVIDKDALLDNIHDLLYEIIGSKCTENGCELINMSDNLLDKFGEVKEGFADVIMKTIAENR